MPDVLQAHSDLIAHLAAHRPRRMVLDPDPDDFTRRARDFGETMAACQSYLVALLSEARDHEPGNEIVDADLIDTINAQFVDLARDGIGTLERIADLLAQERYEGAMPARYLRRRSVNR